MHKPLARFIKKKIERQKKEKKKWKRRNYKQYHRNTKNHKRILWKNKCQQIRQPIRNE